MKINSIIFVSGLLLATIVSCIPLRIPPTIKDFKISKGKKFKNSLPTNQMFIFHDPKDAFEFYNYVNTKFELNGINVHDDVPFRLEGNEYYFSFYEVEIPDKSINLLPIAAGVLLASADIETSMDNHINSRVGNWYIAIEVYSANENDCLKESSPSQKMTTTYLKRLKDEYLSTYNYNEVLFKN